MTPNKHIIFDVNVIIDLWIRENSAEITEAIIDESIATGVKIWVAAPALSTLDYVARRILKRKDFPAKKINSLVAALMDNLLSFVSVLTCYGFNQQIIYKVAHDFEDAQIAATARNLPGAEVCIITEDKTFDALGEVLTLTPAKALPWIRNEKYKELSQIPFIDLAIQQNTILPEIEKNIQTVLNHAKYIMGPEVKELESKLADFVQVRHAVTCSSGTDALLMALMAYGIGPGDAVFTTPFTFIATAEVIKLIGSTPVFVDIESESFNISTEKLAASVKQVSREGKLKPKAVIPVDLFGLPCDYDRINRIASENNLTVIEDAAQSFGAEYKGRMAGSLGHTGCTSFFPVKPLGCYGDGGAVFTDSDEIADKLKSIRIHGKGGDKYDNIRLGVNGRLDTLQAAILLPKLEIFSEELELRRKIAKTYTETLSSHKKHLTLPKVFTGIKSSWAQYSILAADSETRNRIQEKLKNKGIPTTVYYPTPLHLQTAFADSGYRKGDFSVPEDCSSKIFSIPMHPYLNKNETKNICNIILQAL